MSKYIVAGLGVFGYRVAVGLASRNEEVVAIDSNIELIEEIKDGVTQAICMDTTDEKALMSLGLSGFDAGVVGIGENFEANLLTAVLLKNSGVKKVISRAVKPLHIRILKAVGIDEIITPGIEAADKLVFNLIHLNLIDIIQIDEKTSVAKINAPESIFNKTIGEVNLRAKFGINVIAINRITGSGDQKQEKILSNPGADSVIQKGDVLLVIGEVENLIRSNGI